MSDDTVSFFKIQLSPYSIKHFNLPWHVELTSFPSSQLNSVTFFYHRTYKNFGTFLRTKGPETILILQTTLFILTEFELFLVFLKSFHLNVCIYWFCAMYTTSLTCNALLCCGFDPWLTTLLNNLFLIQRHDMYTS